MQCTKEFRLSADIESVSFNTLTVPEIGGRAVRMGQSGRMRNEALA